MMRGAHTRRTDLKVYRTAPAGAEFISGINIIYKAMRIFLGVGILTVMLTSLMSLPVAAQSYTDPTPLTLHITDFGIRQHWTPDLRVGQTFDNLHRRVYPELDATAHLGSQILLPMPEASELRDRSVEDLTNRMALDLIDAVATARANGIETFEIQLVQNIKGHEYFLEGNQRQVKKFGEAAYGAIGRLTQYLDSRNQTYDMDMVLGSNGTVAFTENTTAWQYYHDRIDHVTLVDGRAGLEATTQAISMLGVDRVSISNSHYDWPAPSPTIAAWNNAVNDVSTISRPKPARDIDASIANAETTRELLRRFPDLSAFVVEPVGVSSPLDAHVRIMTRNESEYRVERVLNVHGRIETMPLPGIMKAHEIRDYWVSWHHTRSDSRAANGAVANWWVVNSANKSAGQLRTEAQALSGMARDAQRAVVVGQGPAADVMYHDLADRIGARNIYRVPEVTTADNLQAYAREFGASHILGVATDMAARPQMPDRILVARETARRFAGTTGALSKALEEMNMYQSSADNSVLRSVFGPGRKSLTDGLSVAKNLYDVSAAAERDMADYNDGTFTLMRSHTIEKLAEVGFDKLLPRFYEVLNTNGTLKYLRRGADGKFGAVDFGVIDFAVAGARHIGQGRADIETVTHYCDGANKLAWSVLGLVASGGNSATAAAYEDIGSAAAEFGRWATQPLFNYGFSVIRGDARRTMENWRTEQESRVARNQPIQSVEEYAGGRAQLWNLGFTPWQVKAADKLKSQFEQEQYDHNPVTTFTSFSPGTGTATPDMSDAHTMSRMVSPTDRVVVFGNTDQAQWTYRQLQQNLGTDRVRWVPSDAGRYDRQQAARSFDANVVMRFTQESYRVTTRAGYTQVHNYDRTPAPRVPDIRRRRDEALPDIKYPYWHNDGGGPGGGGFGPGPGGPGGGGGGMTVTSGMRRPFDVGGVLLEGNVAVRGNDTEDANGRFSLVFEDAYGEIDIKALRRFVTAAWAVYFSAEGPGVSIDPIAPGIDKHLVRYIGQVINLDIGRVMREADYLMKKWAVGTERPEIPGFANPDDIAGRNGVAHVGASTRFWFVPETLNFRRAGDMLLFEYGEMALRTEYLLLNRPGEASPEDMEFADYFTRNYDMIAGRYPVFEELLAYAKYTSLARYLKQQGVPLMGFLMANRDLIITEDSPGIVDALMKRSEHFAQMEIHGGVDLVGSSSAANYVFDEATVAALARAAEQYRERQPTVLPAVAPVVGVAAVETAEVDYTIAASGELSASGASANGDVLQTDLVVRGDGQPSLELVRCLGDGPVETEIFGTGWHVMAPFRVTPVAGEKIEESGLLLPRRMLVHNMLTGRDEALTYCDTCTDYLVYMPDDTAGSKTLGLFLLTDRTFRLIDKIGAEYQFDAVGRLTHMLLSDSMQVAFEYDYVSVDREYFPAESVYLSPIDDAVAAVGDYSLPQRLLFVDREHNREEVFVYDTDEAREELGYVPADADNSAYTFLSMMTDGSFVLAGADGTEIAFDRAGAFEQMRTVMVRHMRQDDIEVTFNYEFRNERFRATEARVATASTGEILDRIRYTYQDDGRLGQVTSASGGERSITYDDAALIVTMRD